MPRINSSGWKSGDLKIHNGTLNDIPNGWILCSGHYGTPDLLDRVIVGAGRMYKPNQKFGSDNKGTSNHTLSINQMPLHNHREKFDDYRASGNGSSSLKLNSSSKAKYTYHSGGSQSHNHGPIDVRQQSIALIWIMKL